VTDRSTVQTLAMLIGMTFLLLGVIGFVPGLTTHSGDLTFDGNGSDAKLLGVFQVSVLHNTVHLLFGVAGFALARTWSGARTYLLGGGAFYLALWILGLVNGANWIPANNADDWLHLGLGAGLILVGFASTRDKPAVRAA
jgi:hypothetical protein